MEFLKGKRTLLAFIIGTLMILGCLYASKTKPENFTPLMTVWMSIMAVFVSGNKAQYALDKKFNGDKK